MAIYKNEIIYVKINNNVGEYMRRNEERRGEIAIFV